MKPIFFEFFKKTGPVICIPAKIQLSVYFRHLYNSHLFKKVLHFYPKIKTVSKATLHFTKTRLAPTPSGFLHLGNVVSFVITASLARKNGVKILLRIDDLDQARANNLFLADIFDTLNFLEIPWDEGPRNVNEFECAYSQLNRIELYEAALRQLAVAGSVFGCSCSRKQLINSSCDCMARQISLDSENVAWRLITDKSRRLLVKNMLGAISSAKLPDEMQNFIVKKKDGFPAYQLSSVVDDLFYGVDLVVRGEDLWPSTIAQHELGFALGTKSFNEIAFYHHPLLTGPDGIKLSKSAGAPSIKYLREQGKKPADIFKLIAGQLNIKEHVAGWQQLGDLMSPDLF
jgi:glutamyl-tRNA synthetase